MARITLFEPPEDPDGFAAAWRASRTGLGALLLRSHSPSAEFRFTELAPRSAPGPELPARSHSARYEIVVDDLPSGAPMDFVLVNPFDVPPDEDDEFIRAWTSVRNLVKGRPGYVGSRLHRALDEDARFRFVNVAPWATLADFTAAVTDPAFAHAARVIYHRAHPSLFEREAG